MDWPFFYAKGRFFWQVHNLGGVLRCNQLANIACWIPFRVTNKIVGTTPLHFFWARTFWNPPSPLELENATKITNYTVCKLMKQVYR